MRFLRTRHFWLILLLFILFGFLHYIEQIGFPNTQTPSYHWGLQRHAVDRILLLIPIVYSGLVFNLSGGLIACFVALLIMLPRAVFLSPARSDAVLESIGVIMTAAIVIGGLYLRAKSKKQLELSFAELQVAQKMLRELVHSLHEGERQQATLYAISSTLSESLNLQSVLEKAITMVSELMQVEVTLFFSLEEDTQELRLVAHEGVSDEFVQAMDRIKIGEGFYGEAAKAGEATGGSGCLT